MRYLLPFPFFVSGYRADLVRAALLFFFSLTAAIVWRARKRWRLGWSWPKRLSCNGRLTFGWFVINADAHHSHEQEVSELFSLGVEYAYV
jgi:hypothetical protein